ncbi:uncharacterized protein A4U43_C04F2300 [Asparagus officinalis]|uniref:Uncharacterized protein n=1 Tax=Asparagus officinalis TaxID=4686 RepID=A0A5P1EZF8_ASPOF|nr:uncharacterized protein A4U43_C04F2300 [Asparagus officinalis]
MSNTQNQFNAGHARGVGAAQADQLVGSADSLQAHRSGAAQSAQESKEQAAGFLQQVPTNAPALSNLDYLIA